jgi:hypothetical protein
MYNYNYRVSIEKYPFEISYRDTLFWIGSCFAANMGEMMKRMRFRCEVNPFGALYNPESILSALCMLLDDRRPRIEDLFEHEELWSSFSFHGSFSDVDRLKAFERMNAAVARASKSLRAAGYLFVTFGTAQVFRVKASGEIAGNCHKLPAARFDRETLSSESIAERYAEFAARVASVLPDLKIIFTVSPVRHLKDGAHANSLSKAALLLAVDKLTRLFPEQCFYFPAYEILLDELRDYRFYDADLCHPSALAAEHIGNRFIDAFVGGGEREAMNKVVQLDLARAHRPLHPETAAYRKFVEATGEKERQLRERYPYIFEDMQDT